MSDDADAQRQHLLQLEKLARIRHGLTEHQPVPLHLLPTPLFDEISGNLKPIAKRKK